LTEDFLLLFSMIAIPPLVDEAEIVRVMLSPGAISMSVNLTLLFGYTTPIGGNLLPVQRIGDLPLTRLPCEFREGIGEGQLLWTI
jgi:hypothetical protein